MNRFSIARGTALRWIALAAIGLLAISTGFLQQFRLDRPEELAFDEFRVTSSADAGPGSLREGIIAAARATSRARVALDVPEIVITTPLPPLVNPHGIVLDATRSNTRIIAAALPGTGRVLDIAAGNSAVLGLRISGAADEAIVVRASGVRLQRMTIERSRVGVFVADGSNDVWISESTFGNNTIGIQAPPLSAGVVIQNNTFVRHSQSAVWAVGAPSVQPRADGLAVVRNRFSEDVRAVYAANGNVRVEHNTIEAVRESAIFVSGAEPTILGNRVRSGFAFGIEAVNLPAGTIADNEIDHNCAGGVLMQSSGNVHLKSNRLYANGSGIVIVYGDPINVSMIDENVVSAHMLDALHVIGGSPIVRRNRLLSNQRAGIRLSTVNADAVARVPNPRFEGNVVSGNGMNDVTHDDFEASDGAATSRPDCSWRRGAPVQQLVLAGVRQP